MEEEVARIQEEIKGKRAYFENARRLLAKAAETQGASKRLKMRMGELDAEAKGVYDGLEAMQRAEREAVDAARGKLQVQIDALDIEVKLSEEKIAELTVKGDKIGRRLIIVEHALGVARQRELEAEVKTELEIALEHEEHNKQFLWELGSALFEMRRKEEEIMRCVAESIGASDCFWKAEGKFRNTVPILIFKFFSAGETGRRRRARRGRGPC